MLTSTLPRFSGDPEPPFVQHLACELSNRFDITLVAPMDPLAAFHDHVRGVAIERYRYMPFRSWETLAYPGGIMARLQKEPWRWLQVPFLMLGLIRAIRRLHRAHPFDLVHSHWVIPQAIAVIWALPAKTRPPLLATSHGGDLHIFNTALSRKVLSAIFKRITAITVVSPALRELAQAMPGAANKVDVVPMGVSTRAFRKASRGPREHAPSDTDPIGLLFVGRLVEKKGLVHLLRALSHPSMSHLHWHLKVIGDGPLRDKLSTRARELDLSPRVEFCGARPYDEVRRAMAEADLLVAPSIIGADGDSEGLPTVILEAMASGLPVVSTNHGGISQVIEHRQTGVMVEAGNASALAHAIADLSGHAEERQRLADNALELVQAYDWSRIGERYAEILNRLLTQRGLSE